jgi:hypothetical protein
VGVAAWAWRRRRQQQQQQLRELGEPYHAAALKGTGSSRTSDDVLGGGHSCPDTSGSGWDSKSRSQQRPHGQQQQLQRKGSSAAGSDSAGRQSASADSAVRIDVQPVVVPRFNTGTPLTVFPSVAAGGASSVSTPRSLDQRRNPAQDSSSVLVLGVGCPAVGDTAMPRTSSLEAAAAVATPVSSADRSSPGVPAQPAAAAAATSSVATGLQRWRAAVSSTTVNLIQRRMAGADGGSSSNTSGRAGAASSPDAGQQSSSAGSSSEAGGGPGAAPPDQRQRRPRGRLAPGDSQSIAAAAAAGGFAAAGSSIMRGSGGLQLRHQLGQVGTCWLLDVSSLGLLPVEWCASGPCTAAA